ncbi:MAG: N-acetylmuramoyl-L-alanine amidase-like domain-containing protein [Bacteriovoracaceae bacterium]
MTAASKRMYICLFFVLYSILVANAFEGNYSELTIAEATSLLEMNEDNQDIHDRAMKFSKHFLKRPYQGGPCGEGVDGDYEPKPLSDFSVFDCVTYVEAVMALSFASNAAEFSQFSGELKNIKYCDSEFVCYANRNHFTSLHWIPNAIEKGYLEDITLEVFADSPERMKWIRVNEWYGDKAEALLNAEESFLGENQAKLDELNFESANTKETSLARLHYVPLKNLLTEEVQELIKKEKMIVFNMIKNEFTKPSVGDVKVIVGHQGFIVEVNGELVIRHASRGAGKVDQVSLDDYVSKRMKDTTWPTLGFHLMRIKTRK